MLMTLCWSWTVYFWNSVYFSQRVFISFGGLSSVSMSLSSLSERFLSSWHEAFKCVPWLIHICDTTHSCLWDDVHLAALLARSTSSQIWCIHVHVNTCLYVYIYVYIDTYLLYIEIHRRVKTSQIWALRHPILHRDPSHFLYIRILTTMLTTMCWSWTVLFVQFCIFIPTCICFIW